MTLLTMTGISKRFDGVHALKSASLEVQPGEIHALLGENGAGKSTLMKVLAGVYPADEGSIVLDGRPVQPRNYNDAMQAGISMIFQEPSLFESLTVAENLFIDKLPPHWFGLLNYGQLFAESKTLLNKLEFGLPVTAQVKTLTVGERQLIEIAKATATGAKVIIMDEPTASLNAEESKRLFRLIRQLKANGVGIIYISHRLAEVMELADRFTVLRDGQVMGTWRTGELSQKEIIHKMVGREVEIAEVHSKEDLALQPTVLEVNRLSLPGKLEEVSFSLKRGEILGVAGLRGSGQQILANALLGLESNYQGTIQVFGATQRIKSPQHATQLGIGYVTDDRKREGLLTEMNAAYNGTLGTISKITKHGFLSSQLERDLGDRQVKDLAIRMNARSMPVKHFSGGNQQKVVLARALEQKPRILILNEPTCGIDIGAKDEIYRLITSLAAQGVAVLLISSELAELMALSDRILVMNSKRPSQILAAAAATDEAIIETAIT
jgi:ABC-type sugar transport system ATPase subunit